MKYIYFLILVISLYSCNTSNTDSSSIEKEILQISSNDSIMSFILKEDPFRIIAASHNRSNYQVFFYDFDVNKIQTVNITYDDFKISITFNKLGEITEILKVDRIYNEQLVVKMKKNSIRYEVYSYLENKRTHKITSYIQIENVLDTTAYLFYSKDKSGFQIHTNNEKLSLLNPHLDSLEICYLDENLNDMKFDNPENPKDYFPLFGDRIQKRITNTYSIETKSDLVIGMLWGYFNKKNESPFSYQLLYMHGDLSKRLADFSKEVESIKAEYSGITIRNRRITHDLLQSGLFTLNGKRLHLETQKLTKQ